MADYGEKITRDLTIRYVAVLTILGGLAIVSFLALTRIMLDAESGTAFVNESGRQPGLVQRIAYDATRLTVQDLAPSERNTAKLDLYRNIAILESVHTGLLTGLPELKTPREPSPEINALYFGPDATIDADISAFLNHASALVAYHNESSHLVTVHHPDYQAVVQLARELPLNLDRITAKHLQENEERLVHLSLLHATTLVVILGLLVVSAAGVFQPMVARLKDDIRVRAIAERSLRESEERLWKILEESPVGVSVSRREDGKVVFANRRFCEILGHDKESVLKSYAREHFFDEKQRAHMIHQLKRFGCMVDEEVEFRRNDGTPFWSLLTIRAINFEDQSVNLAWIYDISAMKTAEQKLKLTAQVVESASEAVLITDANNRIEYVNPAFTAITEYTAEEVIGRSPSMLHSGRHDPDFYKVLWTNLNENGRWRGEVWNRRKSGEFYAEWLSIVQIRDDQGQPTHHIAIFSDITHKKEDEERIWRQANYDLLTGLPNRALFMDRLTQTIRQSRRDGSKFAVLFLDLDGFKAVNDQLGHASGDVLLQMVAERLTNCMRSSDTVARLAGDEFTCILNGIHKRSDIETVSAKILATLEKPFELGNGTAHVRASIGISIFPDNGGELEILVKLADEAMYAVKRSGKNNYLFADDLKLRRQTQTIDA